MRNSRLSRAAAALTALAAVAAVAVVGTNIAQAAPPAPGQSLSVTSGTQTTTFTLNLATGNNLCPGDSTTAGGGWRWHQYIVNADLDVETVLFQTAGPVLPAGAPAGSLAQPLYSTTGTPQTARSTLAAGTGQITGATTLNLVENVGIGLPAGRYKMGFVCTQAGVVGRYWESRITVVSTGAATISWQEGWPPAAPTGVSANGADQAINGSFSPVTAVPAVTGYTVTATPTLGAATTVSVPAAGPYTFTIPGLVNGTEYGVTVTASNSVGTGPASSPAVLATPALAPVGAPVASTVTGTGQFTVNWTPSAVPGGATLLSHTVTVSPTVAGSPFSVPAGTNTLVVPAAPGAYSVTVQAVYAAPFVGTASAPVSATSTAAFVGPVIQEVIVERPAGALVLTQRCGVFGSADAFTDNTFGPLPALAASPASADPTNANPLLGWLFTNPVGPGTAPSTVTGTDANGFPTLGALDTPNFGEYPYPVVDATQVPNPTYPTHCGIDLGNARLLTSGEFAGVYFAATGRINQLSVVDTRDLDEGWTLNGRMGTFRSEDDLSDTFHGNLMGWDPEVTWDSAGSFDGYNMAVAEGPSKNPRAETSPEGLRDVPLDNETLSRSLAKANPTEGLGIAVMDARLRLLIPVTADAGTYRGTLTFTVV